MKQIFSFFAFCLVLSLCACSSDDDNSGSVVTTNNLTGSWMMKDNRFFGMQDIVAFDGSNQMYYSGVQSDGTHYVWLDSIKIPYTLENNTLRLKFTYLTGTSGDYAFQLTPQAEDTVKGKIVSLVFDGIDLMGGESNEDLSFIKIKNNASPFTSSYWKYKDETGDVRVFFYGQEDASTLLCENEGNGIWFAAGTEIRVFNNRMIILVGETDTPHYYKRTVISTLKDVTPTSFSTSKNTSGLTYVKSSREEFEKYISMYNLVGSLDSLKAGGYDGTVSVSNLLKAGDFGLGTTDRINGELSILDGKAYSFRSDGKMYELDGTAKVPYATVCKMTPDTTFTLPAGTDLQAVLNAMYTDTINGYAIRVAGSFDSISVRTSKEQTKPYKTLDQVLQTEAVSFDKTNVAGTLICYRFPGMLEGYIPSGYHFHLVSDDKQLGGHVLKYTTSHPLTISVMKLNCIRQLPY